MQLPAWSSSAAETARYPNSFFLLDLIKWKLLCLDILNCQNSNKENLSMCQIWSWFGIILLCTNLFVQSVINLLGFQICFLAVILQLILWYLISVNAFYVFFKKMSTLLDILKQNWCFAAFITVEFYSLVKVHGILHLFIWYYLFYLNLLTVKVEHSLLWLLK